MYKQFGNIEENLPVSIFLSPNFAKWFPYVVRIRIKWLTAPFYMDAVYGRDYGDTYTDNKNSPNVLQLVPFFSDIDVRLLLLIRRRGIGALYTCCDVYVSKRT